MKEIIIIETNQARQVKQLLEQAHIDYKIYQEFNQNWEIQEKMALQEWQNLTDEELISEWEKLPDNDGKNN